MIHIEQITMKTILSIYLILFKGYSVIRFSDFEMKSMEIKRYGACDSDLDGSMGHSGNWGSGDTAVKAIINTYNKSKQHQKLTKYDNSVSSKIRFNRVGMLLHTKIDKN